MRKLKFFIAAIILVACISICNTTQRLFANGEECEYYVGGMTAGFLLNVGGVQIVGLNEVTTEQGTVCPANEVGLRAGDVISEVNSIEISTSEQLNCALEKFSDSEIELTVKRGGETAKISIKPVKEKKTGKMKIGVLIRDSVSGIGTITYIQKDTLKFGALGHAVTSENKDCTLVADKRVYSCSIIGVNKGIRGKAGELRGLFINDKCVGYAEKISSTGLYGRLDKDYNVNDLQKIKIAPLSEATIGKAEIYSTIDGITPQKFNIAIVKVDARHKEHKNFVIKITDETLINATGGIVQGMSGSPIIQNGKLIGAVTHVFLNDPTRGYAIGIENMICE